MSAFRRAFVVSAASLPIWLALPARARDVVAGSATLRRERRAPGAFEAIAVSIDADVTLRRVDEPFVELRADDNLLDAIRTSVRAGTLHIETAEGVRLAPSTRVAVEVGFVALDAISLAGSGRIDGTGVRGGSCRVASGGNGTIALAGLELRELECSVGGSGRVALDGASSRFSLAVGGSGAVEADRLIADDVAVRIGGSGGARVRAERRLLVSIAGSGEVVHSGAAVPQVAIAGSGRVRRA